MARDLRILQRKLERSEKHRGRLEVSKEQNDRTLRRLLVELQTNQALLVDRNAELLSATHRLVDANRSLQETQLTVLESEERAQQASRAKSTFLANMSHEVRTPLNAVMGLSGLLARSSLDAGQLELLQTIRESGRALLTMIDDLLDFSKLEYGALEFEVSDVDPRALVEGVVALFGAQVEASDVELLCFIDPLAPSMVRAEESRLRQVLMNLVGNAIKFTERGHVTVRLDALQPQGICLQVLDTGPGFDEAAAEILFAPFVQGDATTTRRHGGTGLGLSIARQIVEAMGGVITVQSRVGSGASFVLELPLEQPPLAQQPLGTVPAPRLGQRVIAFLSTEGARSVAESALENFAEVTFCSSLQAADAEAEAAAMRGDDVVMLFDVRDGQEGAPSNSPFKVVYCVPLSELATGSGGAGERISHPLRPSRLRTALLQTQEAGGRPRPERPERKRNQAPTDLGACAPLRSNPTNQHVATLLLQAVGCTVELAYDGEQAVQRWQERGAEREYDLILMDCQMPEMDGFSATRKIRSLEREVGRARTTIIALTASAVRQDRERCLAAGMDDHLAKPISPEALESLLGAWVPQTRGLGAPNDVILAGAKATWADFSQVGAGPDHEMYCGRRRWTLTPGKSVLSPTRRPAPLRVWAQVSCQPATPVKGESFARDGLF